MSSGIRRTHDPVQTSAFLGYVMLAATVLSAWGTYYLANEVLPAESQGVRGYITAATPFFFFLIGVEMLLYAFGAAPKSTAGHFDSVDSWSSLAAGTTQTIVLSVYRRLVPFLLWYANTWENYRLLDLEDNWVTLAIAFVLSDFCYYWLHRHAHVYHFLWAGHATHHSSEHYNLSTALRQSWWQGITGVVRGPRFLHSTTMLHGNVTMGHIVPILGTHLHDQTLAEHL